MKVQAKSPCSSPMYVVVEESPNYYIAKDSNGFLINLRKSDYEPVQEWVDVTHECHLHKDNGGYIWFGYNKQVCGHYKNPNTRIIVNNLGEIRVEVKK